MILYILHAAVLSHAIKGAPHVPLMGHQSNPELQVLHSAVHDLKTAQLPEVSSSDKEREPLLKFQTRDQDGNEIEDPNNISDCKAHCPAANNFLNKQSWVKKSMMFWFVTSLIPLLNIFGVFSYLYVNTIVNRALCIGKKAKGSSVAEKSTGWVRMGTVGSIMSFSAYSVFTGIYFGWRPCFLIEKEDNNLKPKTTLKIIFASGVIGQILGVLGMLKLNENMNKWEDLFPSEKMY